MIVLSFTANGSESVSLCKSLNVFMTCTAIFLLLPSKRISQSSVSLPQPARCGVQWSGHIHLEIVFTIRNGVLASHMLVGEIVLR